MLSPVMTPVAHLLSETILLKPCRKRIGSIGNVMGHRLVSPAVDNVAMHDASNIVALNVVLHDVTEAMVRADNAIASRATREAIGRNPPQSSMAEGISQ